MLSLSSDPTKSLDLDLELNVSTHIEDPRSPPKFGMSSLQRGSHSAGEVPFKFWRFTDMKDVGTRCSLPVGNLDSRR